MSGRIAKSHAESVDAARTPSNAVAAGASHRAVRDGHEFVRPERKDGRRHATGTMRETRPAWLRDGVEERYLPKMDAGTGYRRHPTVNHFWKIWALHLVAARDPARRHVEREELRRRVAAEAGGPRRRKARKAVAAWENAEVARAKAAMLAKEKENDERLRGGEGVCTPPPSGHRRCASSTNRRSKSCSRSWT